MTTLQTTLFRTLKRFRKDESGNISLIFGTIFVLLIAMMGAGYDMNQLTSSKHKASSIADTVALTAAIYYSTHGELPATTDDGFVDGHVYNASDLNYAFNGLSNKTAENVKIKVTYDLDLGEATTQVYGNTQVAFLQVFGYSKLDFKAVSVAKFSESEMKDPASIIMVLDNSGSMSFDDMPNDPNTGANPPEAERRITALERGVNSLMDTLRAMGADGQPVGERYLRTGMINYATTVFTGPGSTSIPMKWGTLTTAEVNAMVPGGGTNSNPPMSAAKNELDGEDLAHLTEHGDDDPIKFLIFMTDGQNNNTSTTWEAAAGTELWRRWVEVPGHNVWTCHRWGCHNHWKNGSSGWEEQDSPTMPAGTGWEEGLYTGNLDVLTRATCDALRADGVHVYSIGFALESGTFDTNEWGAGSNPDTYDISRDVKRAAVHMMKQCSGVEYPERFMIADNADTLEEAFEQIGVQIVKEVVRLSM